MKYSPVVLVNCGCSVRISLSPQASMLTLKTAWFVNPSKWYKWFSEDSPEPEQVPALKWSNSEIFSLLYGIFITSWPLLSQVDEYSEFSEIVSCWSWTSARMQGSATARGSSLIFVVRKVLCADKATFDWALKVTGGAIIYAFLISSRECRTRIDIRSASTQIIDSAIYWIKTASNKGLFRHTYKRSRFFKWNIVLDCNVIFVNF